MVKGSVRCPFATGTAAVLLVLSYFCPLITMNGSQIEINSLTEDFLSLQPSQA